MSSSRDLGASIGRSLAEARSGEGVPRVAATEFIEGVWESHPKVKLPELLANEAVRDWMERVGVSEGALRSALTETRRVRREAAQVKVTLGLPPRSRRTPKKDPDAIAAAAPVRRKSVPGLFDDGIVPNRPPRSV